MPSAAENVKEIGTLIDLGVKCLEGTTERSDGNTKFADESERSELSEQTR